MHKSLVVGNWKMNPETLTEAKKLFEQMKKGASRASGAVVICPPTPFISQIASILRAGKLSLGAQNVSHHEGGSHTGEYSAAMLKSSKVNYVIIGHSERRAEGESDEMVSLKIAAALRNRLKPIVCIGEKVRDRDGEYLEDLRSQLRGSFHGINAAQLRDITIAYEPVWAIGRTAAFALAANELLQTTLFIRKVLSQMYDTKVALAVGILYGGSVDKTNVGDIAASGAVSGALVGRASLDPEEFSAIIKTFAQA